MCDNCSLFTCDDGRAFYLEESSSIFRHQSIRVWLVLAVERVQVEITRLQSPVVTHIQTRTLSYHNMSCHLILSYHNMSYHLILSYHNTSCHLILSHGNHVCIFIVLFFSFVLFLSLFCACILWRTNVFISCHMYTVIESHMHLNN